MSRRRYLGVGAAVGAGLLGVGATGSATAAPPDVPDENFRIYLAFGQSNMEGQGTIESQDRETNDRVHLLADMTCSSLDREYGNWYVAQPPLNRCGNVGGLGPLTSFGKTMAAETPEAIHIGLAPAAVSGADIALFEKSAPIGRGERNIPDQFASGYEWLRDLAERAHEAGTIDGILLHQGETNNGEEDWDQRVAGIVDDLKADVGFGDVPLIAGETLYEQYGGCCSLHNEEINELPNTVPNAHVVSAAGLEGQDFAHFTTEAYRELGQRYAQKMLEVNPIDVQTPTDTPTPTIDDGPTWPEDATDPDHDGHYEDLTGNGEIDNQDLVTYFQNMGTSSNPSPMARNENLAYFDYSGNQQIDYQDLITLFGEIA